jgi:CO/xanthine dehydrogenase Mo-binding subunit
VTCSFQLLRQLDGAGVAACRKRLGVPRVDDRRVLNGIFNSHDTFPVSSGGVYNVPACDIRLSGVYSNKVPLDAYRGAGRR